MPSGAKNVKFTNRHANEANSRKAEENAKDKAQSAKADDDNFWRDDDDKQGKKKAERAADKDEKDRLAKERKAEREDLLEAEEKDMAKKPPKAVSKKEQQRLMVAMARDYDMESRMKNDAQADGDLSKQHDKAVKESRKLKDEKLVNGNLNREGGAVTAGGGGGGNSNAQKATGVSASVAALEQALGGKTPAKIEDRHVGKRARVAYRKFEAANLESMKESKPGLRRTQYSDMMWIMWQKSPENPFVQRQVRRADEMLERKWCQNDQEPSDDEGMEDE